MSFRQSHSNIQFGDSNFDSESSELFHVGLKSGRDFTNDQVSLKTDTVDGNALSFEAFDEVEHGGGFGADAFDVEVIDLVRVGKQITIGITLDRKAF